MFVQKEEVGVFRLELVVSGLSGVMKTKMTMVCIFMQWTQGGAARALGLIRPRVTEGGNGAAACFRDEDLPWQRETYLRTP